MSTSWNKVGKASGTAYAKVPKSTVPSKTTESIFAGNPIGLLLALTYATASSFTSGGWKNVPKAITPNSWTKVPKVT